MFALYLWLFAIAISFCAGYATAYSERRRNRRRLPPPAHNVIRFDTKARGRVA